MKFHLSIFSFDTLKIKPFIPRAWILAIFTFLVLNLLAHTAYKKKLIFTSIPFAQVKEMAVTAKSPYDIWFIGNSTLANAVQEEQLEKLIGKQTAHFTLGSSDFRTMTEITIHLLKHSKRSPKTIFIFCTKDDFNVNGDRGQLSIRYRQAIYSPPFSEVALSEVPIYSCRYSIRKYCRNALVLTWKWMRKKSAAKKKIKKFKNLAADYNTTYLCNQGRKYHLRLKEIEKIGDYTSKRKIELYIVFPPVAKSVANWQQNYYPQLPWNIIKQKVSNLAAKSKMKVLDFTDLYPSTTEYFKDPYHLTSYSANLFTLYLAKYKAIFAH